MEPPGARRSLERHRGGQGDIIHTVAGRYLPESPEMKAVVLLLAVIPFAFVGTFIARDVWYIAAIPLASVTLGWLGRRLLRLDDDQQPGAATSIRMPRRGAESGQSRRAGDPAGIAPRTGQNG